MKPVLFYDTETNGLVKFGLPSSDPSQPHITQLAAELCDVDTGRVLGSMDLLIAPDRWTIPTELEQLTGITNELAQEFGIPIGVALDLFMDLWTRSTLRVAHNEGFDMRMVRIELMHSPYSKEFADKWKLAPAYCTQANSTKLLNEFREVGQKKTANLGEAYEFFTGKKLEGAHNAAVDLAACKAVYAGIQARAKQAA